ncbi:hypothetical protein SAMN04488515_2814 [Cognatiyoonia koreensis]|uniref:Secreted protein n=1 Tax=Cognatiyoonia koreensis TaxID=364200 RepID=A0A1I0RJZ1_9RHOB|nr:hypothetical protein [Cognatiyoonia koreensis]SEW41331.1 hypothetical protein SAMN04488515_2814 [Cognatiyoonia koreensis]
MFRLFCIFLFLASAAAAQDIIVRTGDHLNFTRVVFSIPPGTAWSVGPSADGYGVRFDTEKSIDTAGFFTRIRRERIAAIRLTENGTALRFALACDCFAEVDQLRADLLVLDIKDPDQPRGGGYDAANDQRFVELDLPVTPAPNPHPPALVLPIRPETRTQSAKIDVPRLPLDGSDRGPPGRPDGLPDPLAEYANQQVRVADLETTISDGLSRALSQGLLAPSDGASPSATTEGPPENTLSDLLDAVNAALTPGLSARTSVDRAMQSDLSDHADGQPAFGCVAASDADVANWIDDTPFAQQIGTLRRAITGEFDRTDPAAVEALSKAYLAFGFGREAINTLEIDGELSRSRQVLVALGQVVDEDTVDLANFNHQMTCPGPIALWAFLAHTDGPLTGEVDLDAIVIDYKLLPNDLRRHLAPRLAGKLTSLGRNDLAATVLAGQNGTDETAVKIAESGIAEDQGDLSAATGILSDLAEDDPRITPEAFLKLVALKRVSDVPFEQQDLLLLRTLQFESQNEMLTRDLFAAEADILVSLNDTDGLLDLIETQAKQFDEAQIAQYHDAVLQKEAADASDAEFLQLVFSDRVQATDPPLQNKIARRLLTLGFSDQAERAIAGPAVGADMAERRYLRAEIAIKQGNVDRARAHLSGITSARAQLLLAQGGVEPDDTVLAGLPQDARDQLGWRFGNWGQLGNTEDRVLNNVARRVDADVTFDVETDRPLASSRSLIDDSTTLRTDLGALLDRYKIAEGETSP